MPAELESAMGGADFRHATWPCTKSLSPRGRRNGRGLSRHGHQPQAPGRDQGPAATVGADPERLARFQREAEVLAVLNHPNIAHIHGLEKSNGALALVMELVEGPTLADRLRTGRSRSPKRCRSPGRSPKRWKRRMSRGSSIAI